MSDGSIRSHGLPGITRSVLLRSLDDGLCGLHVQPTILLPLHLSLLHLLLCHLHLHGHLLLQLL